VFVLVACLDYFVDVRVTYLVPCRAGACRMKISEIFISFVVELFVLNLGSLLPCRFDAFLRLRWS
jgi:hypothetical protein